MRAMSSTNPSHPSTPTTAQQQQASAISHPAHTLLARAHSPDSAARIFHDKVRTKPLLLQPTDSHAHGQAKRALRRHIRERKKAYHRSKQHPRPLSAREKRQKGLYDLQPAECRYETYRGLHRLWTGYVWEILGFTDAEGKLDRARIERGGGVSAASQGSLLASMDFHGMELEVVRCRDVCRVGLKGIVVRETKYSFVVVGPGDKVRRVMKGGTVFRVQIDLPGLEDVDKQREREGIKDQESTDEQQQQQEEEQRTSSSVTKGRRQLVFELHGDQLEIRPIERAVKKFKWKTMDYL